VGARHRRALRNDRPQQRLERDRGMNFMQILGASGERNIRLGLRFSF
jgi:hypothetical protein